MNSTHFNRSQVLSPWRIQWPALRRATAALAASLPMGAVVGVLLTAGCAGLERESQPEAAPQAAPGATAVSVEPKAAAPLPPRQSKAAEPASTSDKAKQAGVVPAAPPVQGAAKATAAPPKAPAQPPAAPSAAAPTKIEPSAAAPAKPQAAAPLDLKSLETRLKETPAIGVFTKLALKNQIDELLDRFRAFYQGKLKTSLAELRRSYDMLVLKVLALLQDADPPLASAIAGSREAIWGILSNPAKFAAV